MAQPTGITLIDIGQVRPNDNNPRLIKDHKFSTFEPSLDVKDIFKPDLLMLNGPTKKPTEGYAAINEGSN